MDVELVTIGTELLLGFTLDTNAAELGRALSEVGIRVVRHSSVADTPSQISAVLHEALQRSGTVITTGGLGPTRDDISREVAADVMAMPLRFDDAIWAGLGERYRRLGRELPESNRPQAMVPEGAIILPNQWGTAPGLWLENARGRLIMLPGVPFEMRLLLTHEVIPRLLAARHGNAETVIRSRTLRTNGIGESVLAERIGTLDQELAPLTLAYLPQTTGVDLRLTAWSLPAADADALLEAGVQRLRPIIAKWYYGDGDTDLAAVVLDLLRNKSLTLALAESCTGGLLASRFTEIPGSSDVFLGAAVAYAYSAKTSLLDVPQTLLDEVGAVSQETAAALAEGAARRLGADVAISITGIAGPGGGTPTKPVGTVWVGYWIQGRADQVRLGLPGTRAEIRERAIAAALVGVRQRLLEA